MPLTEAVQTLFHFCNCMNACIAASDSLPECTERQQVRLSMTKNTAKQISDLMVSMGAQLNESIRAVQQSEDETDFKRYREVASKLMTTMLLEIMNPLYVEHPDLKQPEME